MTNTSLLEAAIRLYPRAYRQERGEEMLSVALEAAGGSRLRACREAVSFAAGALAVRARFALRQPARDAVDSSAWLSALILSVVNLAVALAGLTARVQVLDFPVSGLYLSASYPPYVVDWWWIAFTIVALVLLVALARRWGSVARIAASANVSLVVYDALVLADRDKYDGNGHFDVFTYAQSSSFPGGREWVAAASVLALATFAAARRPRSAAAPLRLLSVALVLAVSLALLAHVVWGAFFFLRWPLIALIVLAACFGWLQPQLPVVAAALAVAALPSTLVYLTAPNLTHRTSAVVGAALAVGAAVIAPLHLLRRRYPRA